MVGTLTKERAVSGVNFSLSNSHPKVVTDGKIYIEKILPNCMKKLNFEAKTLEDRLIIDGLCAISALEERPFSKDTCFLVGGFATQSYLPSQYRRGTSDIDLAIIKPLLHSEFKEYAAPTIEVLRAKSYEVITKKGQNAYEVVFSNKNDAGVIEFSRKGVNRFERTKDRLQREIENSRKKIIPGTNSTCKVSSPEDIALPKMVRGIGSLSRNPGFSHYIGSKVKPINEGEIKRHLDYLKELREEATIHVGDHILSEKLRFVSDIYDIRALSEVVGFNEAYIKTAAKDWDVLKDAMSKKDMLFSYLLPNILLD